MKCNACGSESGFVGRQPVHPVTKEPTGPESVWCETCGAEVRDFAEQRSIALQAQSPTPDILVGVPAHLQDSFDGAQLVTGDDDDPGEPA